MNQWFIDYSFDEIISGNALGVDSLAARLAEEIDIKYTGYDPDWYPSGEYDKSAGFKRNLVMVRACDEAIIFWDGKSSGSKHTIDLMLAAKKPLIVIPV